MRGAEAILKKAALLGKECVVKTRAGKKYRVRELDERLRRERTRSEARLLHKAKLAGVRCPTVLEVDDFGLVLSFIDGRHPGMSADEAAEAGRVLAKLHEADIIHGDFTPANLFIWGKKMFVIDFGLGLVSNDIEDKAVDVFTMLRSLDSVGKKGSFITGYRKYSKAESVLERVKDVEKRVRYAF